MTQEKNTNSTTEFFLNTQPIANNKKLSQYHIIVPHKKHFQLKMFR